jgi:hypothetical protein
MRKLIYLPLFILGLVSCTKEVQIDIPGYEEKLVVDGNIETGAPPIVLLSTTNNIYSPTNLQAYLEGFISGATVTVSDGTNTVVLDEICTDNLPAGTEEIAAQLFGIPADQLASLHLCAYTSFNTDIWGQVGKTYTLTIQHEGKTYTSSTQILQPTPLVNTFWKPDGNFTDRGFSWATLADPANQYDAYRWEVKYLNDAFFTKTFSPFTDDEFFNGLTFEFSYENPMTCNGEYQPEEYRCYYKKNDTIVIKISKCDRNTYEFMERKYTQIFSAGNPFASPTNIPSNISGGAFGLWAGYSPWYDTLICVE